MRNFRQLAREVDVMPLLMEIQRQPDLWDENTLRTKHPGTAHAEVSDIWLWFNPPLKNIGAEDQAEMFNLQKYASIINDREVIPYRAWHLLPSVRNIIFPLMRQVQAVRLGRCMITRLPPGKAITPHVDGGAPATYYQRYQVALQCLPGNQFRIDDEKVEFRSGDIWYIDNTKEHEVINNSTDDRIVMIVDLRSE